MELMKKIDQNKLPGYAKWLAPDYWASSVSSINFSELSESEGIDVVVFDIDSTLAHYGKSQIDPEVLSAIKSAQENGGIKEVAIATNRRIYDFVDITKALGENVNYVHALSFLDSKPFRKYFDRLISKIGKPPHKCAMVGDKLFTDIIGAKRYGMLSIMVDRLGEDSTLDKISPLRSLERYIAKHYSK